MENIMLAHQRILSVEEVLPAMDEVLDLVEGWLRRHDQEKELMQATEDVSIRVESELSQELLAYQLNLQRNIQDNQVGLVVDVVKELLGGRMQPRPHGAAKIQCFRRVLVGVGPEGVPDDLRVVNVSQLAREWNVSESAVEKALLAQGLSLFTLQIFDELAAWLGREVLAGRIRLPYRPSEMAMP